jgi:mRNA-degrading endonuclease RelE of RelBE toxin-antitoxin system
VGYQIEVSPSAQKEIKALPGYARTQARQLIRGLGETPRPSRAKELRGKPNIYRIWLERRWRIAYTVDDELQLVRILRVRPKEYIDYESL